MSEAKAWIVAAYSHTARRSPRRCKVDVRCYKVDVRSDTTHGMFGTDATALNIALRASRVSIGGKITYMLYVELVFF
jgi:hypothetical protein